MIAYVNVKKIIFEKSNKFEEKNQRFQMIVFE